mmetsp:Transcript_98375/g.195030  ORF Transcript_98375/g.195030 Transcript_98375/m.195030 type:complete len:240 (+) Transcript_98375:55-774(+)
MGAKGSRIHGAQDWKLPGQFDLHCCMRRENKADLIACTNDDAWSSARSASGWSSTKGHSPLSSRSTVCSEGDSTCTAETTTDAKELLFSLFNSPGTSARADHILSPMTPTWGRLHGRGFRYEGELFNGTEHGRGVRRWDDGRQYHGQFQRGQLHGVGTMTWPDGRKYEGEYQQDHKHGEGMFIWSDGSFFCGQWIDGKKHGIGSYTSSEGVTQEGHWVQDQQMFSADTLIKEIPPGGTS